MKRLAYSLVRTAGLVLAIGLAVCAASAETPGNALRGFIAADLDGDHSRDLARVGDRRHEGSGYLQDVQIRIGSHPEGTLRVHTASPVQRLTARDLDGDTDRDLVLESFDGEAQAVLLNDGRGRFHQANLADYAPRLPGRGQRSIEAPPPDTESAGLDLGLGASAAAGEEPGPAYTLPATRFNAACTHCRLLFHYADSASRGPPSLL